MPCCPIPLGEQGDSSHALWGHVPLSPKLATLLLSYVDPGVHGPGLEVVWTYNYNQRGNVKPLGQWFSKVWVSGALTLLNITQGPKELLLMSVTFMNTYFIRNSNQENLNPHFYY